MLISVNEQRENLRLFYLYATKDLSLILLRDAYPYVDKGIENLFVAFKHFPESLSDEFKRKTECYRMLFDHAVLYAEDLTAREAGGILRSVLSSRGVPCS
nr:hypothetical protein [Sicyoidochytrium minutum DNA virus]